MLVGGITCDREMFIFMCFPGFTFHHNTNVISVKATGEELLSYGLYQPWDLTALRGLFRQFKAAYLQMGF